MIKIVVMNAKEATEFSYNSEIPVCKIISVSNIGEYNDINRVNQQIESTLFLNFNDMEEPDFGAMTSSQAEEVIKFVEDLGDDTMLIVQCTGGKSRSAGIAAALEHILNGAGSEEKIFETSNYAPNLTCYRQIMKKYYNSYNPDYEHYLIERNQLAWNERLQTM